MQHVAVACLVLPGEVFCSVPVSRFIPRSPLDGHLGRFHFGGVRGKAAVDTCFHVSWVSYVGVGLLGECVFNFDFPKVVSWFAFVLGAYVQGKSSFHTSLLTPVIVSLLNFSRHSG